MPVNLSIKSVPDSLVEQLRIRAKNNHRSLQGELMTILETSLGQFGPTSVEEAVRRLRNINIETGPDSVELIRHERDKR